jgi:hypothetical protein
MDALGHTNALSPMEITVDFFSKTGMLFILKTGFRIDG